MASLNLKSIKILLLIFIVTSTVTFLQKSYYESKYNNEYIPVYYLNQPVLKNDRVTKEHFEVIYSIEPPNGSQISFGGFFASDYNSGTMITTQEVSDNPVDESRNFTLVSINAQYSKLCNLKIGQEIELFHEYKGIVEEIGYVVISRLGSGNQNMLGGNAKQYILVAGSERIIRDIVSKSTDGEFLVVISN